MRTSSRPRSMSRSRSSRAPIPRAGRRAAVVWTTTPWTIPVNQAIAYEPESNTSSRIVGKQLACSVAASSGRTEVLSCPSAFVQRLSDRCRSSSASHVTQTHWCQQGLGARRHHRPPPDAQARRVLRQAAAVPARRLRHHRPGHRPRPHGARPWRGRFRAVQGGRHRPGVRGRAATANIARTGCGSAARAASSTPSSTRPTGRSAPTCARPARCSPRAPTSSTATRIRGGRRPRSSTAAPRNGSSPWTGRSSTSPLAREQRRAKEGGELDAPLVERAQARRCASWRCKAIADTRFVPEKGRNRIGSMVEERPDWVISRQRAWGVPIALFVERKTGELLVDPRGQPAHRRRRPRAAASTPGTTATPAPCSATAYPDDYETVRPTSSTSGSTAAAPTSSRWRAAAGPTSAGRADLYLEGSRPASRLVPVVAARKLRHARPRALRRGADPRLHDGRQGHENVQEPGQHGQPARPDEGTWRRHPAAVGAVGRLHRGPPDRQGNPRRRRRPVSQAAQQLPLSARRARRVQRGRAGRATSPRCPSSSATCCT